MERIIFAIDVGTTKVCTLVGEVQAGGALRITGVGVAPSRGLDKGTVVDVQQATSAIRASVQEAGRISGVEIERAFVGVSGLHIASVNSRGTTVVSRSTRGVNEGDVARSLESAQTIAVPYSHGILHAIPRSYALDGQNNIRNPIGMYGHRLEVEAHLVTAASTSTTNLVKCVQGAGGEVENLVLQSLASGEAVLTEEERESGVVLVDIGGGTTDVAIFLDGSVWHSAVIGVGGQSITNDLVICLQMPTQAAEELKIRCGHAEPAEISEGETVDIAGFGDQSRRTISRRLLAEIIEARVERIFAQVGKEIKRSGYSGLLPAGVVLCGGSAQLGGMRSVARRILGMPVRIGSPQGVRGLVDVVSNPAYACSVGLLEWARLYGDKDAGNKRASSSGWSGRLRSLMNIFLPG